MDLMLVMELDEATDWLAMASSVYLYGRLLRRVVMSGAWHLTLWLKV